MLGRGLDLTVLTTSWNCQVPLLRHIREVYQSADTVAMWAMVGTGLCIQ